MKALSIRQPWAWLIVNGHKDIENRDWSTRLRGPILIHASKGMTRAEYEDGRCLAETLGVTLPDFGALERGGIVGRAVIAGCVTHSDSPWFFGKFGFSMVEAAPLPFRPLRGSLGFFDVESRSMTDTYTPILTDAQIGAIVCDVYKKTGAAEIGELRLKQDAVALGRAVERAAIAAYQRRQLISVEDRLPPAGDTLVYAIHVDGEPEIVCASLIHETFPDRAYSHWMPLPPAPETQS